MKKIDAHAHAARSAFPARLSRADGTVLQDFEELKKIYDASKITRGVLMPLVSPEGQTFLVTNEDVFEITHKYPNTFYWCCNIDPRMGDYKPTTDFSRLLLFYKKLNAIGIGELTAGLRLDDPLVDNLLFHCGECDMPVTIHWSDKPGSSYGLYGGENMKLLKKALNKYPKLKVIGHSVPFWDLMSYHSDDIQQVCMLANLMRECRNLYCDTSANSGYSALSKNPEITYEFINEFEDRILFGLDISYVGETLYNKIDAFFENSFSSGAISKQAYEKIYYQNAMKLYGITEL